MKSSAKAQKSVSAGEKSFHMTPKQFREYGRAVVDWIADYYEQVESMPVLIAGGTGGDSGGTAGGAAEARREIRKSILQDMNRVILPGVTHWQSPNFFALFSGECFGCRNSGRHAFSWDGRARDVVGDESGMHGSGDACAGLAGGNAGTAGEIFVDGGGRRGDTGYGVEFFALRAAGGARASYEIREQPAGMRRKAGGIYVEACAFFD